MRRVFFAFLLLLLSIWAGLQLSQEPGHILINFKGWTIETSVWVGLFILIASFMGLYFLLRIFSSIKKIPKLIRLWLERYRMKRAERNMRLGIQELNEGSWKKAKKRFMQALPYSQMPLLNYLASARAAQEMNNPHFRDECLKAAENLMPEAKMAIGLTQAKLALANQEWQTCLTTLKDLQEIAPHQPAVLNLLLSLYRHTQQWHEVIALLPQLKYYAVIDNNTYLTLLKESYVNYLQTLIQTGDNEQIHYLMSTLPKSLNYDAALVKNYAYFLIQQKQHKEAEKILKEALKKEVNDELIYLYGDLQLNEKAILFLKKLIAQHPEKASLYFSAGKLCFYNKLWGKARDYFLKNISLSPNQEGYLALGKLYQLLEDPLLACESYQKGLSLAVAIKPHDYSMPHNQLCFSGSAGVNKSH